MSEVNIFLIPESILPVEVAMGSPVASVVANIFMEDLEERALRSAGSVKPRLWKRYVDDVFAISKKLHTKSLLAHVNSIDEQIVFTMEREEDCKLPFLDVSVHRGEGGSLRRSVYRKPTHTDQLLQFNSHHATSAKSAVVHSLVNRLDTHFADDDIEGKEAEQDHIVEVLSVNGYPERFVRHVMQRKERGSDAEFMSEQKDDLSAKNMGQQSKKGMDR